MINFNNRKKIMNIEFESDHYFIEEQIDVIMKHDLQCQHCHTSIFDMQDFPNVRKKDIEELKIIGKLQYKDIEFVCEDCERELFGVVCEKCQEFFTLDENKGIVSQHEKLCFSCWGHKYFN